MAKGFTCMILFTFDSGSLKYIVYYPFCIWEIEAWRWAQNDTVNRYEGFGSWSMELRVATLFFDIEI